MHFRKLKNKTNFGKIYKYCSRYLVPALLLTSCQPASDTAPQFNMVSNEDIRVLETLTQGALRKNAIQICASYLDVSEPLSTIQVDWLNKVTQISETELNGWLTLSPATAKTYVTSVASKGSCPYGDFGQGRLTLKLFWNQANFYARLGQTSVVGQTWRSNDVQEAILINVTAVRTRDKSHPESGSGRSWTIVHEIGHALGLDHENSAPSVMAPSMASPNMRTDISADDKNGYINLVAKVSDGKVPMPAVRVPHPDPEQSQDALPVSQAPTTDCSVALPSVRATPIKAYLTRPNGQESTVTAFKRNGTDAITLPDNCKCLIEQQSFNAMIPTSKWPTSGHIEIQLLENIPGCAFGKAGTVGFLFAPHWAIMN